ncbi:UTP-glucose-1-phosphate uridylyltransferase [Bacillus phage SP-15]|uniref:UTP--glucose-1-phosphate uridylyltransferase n=1 Tax=Bacillus phage SP-15 TaxID=1792032 RepID=A0A127AW70_9CAUD|nr:UTP-glucose-1-phosphate uridylyltransferase [Bacillus phage SP-15]AMM44946.1 UTP-glucose-1-phosphate uridylyltransferase [Bacillus phage SP-15]
MQVRKAIIPAAGLGTRFLPATKAQPKEMLSLIDRPVIEYIVREIVESGITEILIITGRDKRSIENHFDSSPELERTLEERGKLELVEELRKISSMAKIYYTRQKEALGLGHAVLQAKEFVGNEPFAVLLGDDIMHCNGTPCLKQMLDRFELFENPIIAAEEVPDHMVSSYGIFATDGDPLHGAHQVVDMVEKPSLEEAPSNLAVMGRYILTPDIFPILETIPTGAGGEIQLTDAIKELIHFREVYAYKFEGKRYDAGNKVEFIKASIELGLERNDIAPLLKEYIIELGLKLSKE